MKPRERPSYVSESLLRLAFRVFQVAKVSRC